MASEEILQSKAQKTNQLEKKKTKTPNPQRATERCAACSHGPGKRQSPVTMLWFGSAAQRGERL